MFSFGGVQMKKIINQKIEEWFLVIGFFLLVLLVFSNFLSRYVFDYSLSWSQEFSGYLLIWLAWISVSFTIREERHIRVETLRDLLPELGQKIIEFIALILWSLFAIFLAYVGTQFVLDMKITGQKSPLTEMPMWMVYLILPLAGFLMLIRLIQQMILIFKKDSVKESAQ